MNQGQIIPQVTVTAVHENLSQEVVSITEDKLRLILIEHAENLGRSRDWVAPAGILVPILLTFASADFKKFIFEGTTWKTLFAVSAVAAAVWFAVTLAARRRAPSVSDLVEKIKRPQQSK